MLQIKRGFGIKKIVISPGSLILFMLFFALFIYSCNNQQKTKNAALNSDSQLILLPAPTPILEADKLKYAAGCKA